MNALLFSILFYLCFGAWIIHEAIRRILFWIFWGVSFLHNWVLGAQGTIADAMGWLHEKIETDNK